MADPTLDSYNYVADQGMSQGGLPSPAQPQMPPNALTTMMYANQAPRESQTVSNTQKDTGTLKRFMGIDPETARGVMGLVEETPAVTELKEGIANQEGALQKMMGVAENAPVWAKTDLTMPLAFFDELNGTNFSKGYKPYKSPEGVISNMRTSLLATKGKLAGTREKLFKGMLKDTQQSSQAVGGTQSTTKNEGGLDVGARANLGLRQQAFDKAENEQTSKGMKEIGQKFEGVTDALSQLDTVASIFNKYGQDGDIPGVGKYTSTLEYTDGGDKSAIGKIAGVVRSSLGGEYAQEQLDADRMRQALGDLNATVRKLYSGTASSDKEAKAIADIQGMSRATDVKSFAAAMNRFNNKIRDDITFKMNLIKNDPVLSRAWERLDPQDLASVNDFEKLLIAAEDGNVIGESKSALQKKREGTLGQETPKGEVDLDSELDALLGN